MCKKDSPHNTDMCKKFRHSCKLSRLSIPETINTYPSHVAHINFRNGVITTMHLVVLAAVGALAESELQLPTATDMRSTPADCTACEVLHARSS